MSNHPSLYRTAVLFLCLAAALFAAPARGQGAQEAPTTAKVRVLILPLSGTPPRVGWAKPHGIFRRDTIAAVSRILLDQGFFEVVPDEEVVAAGGGEDIPPWRWLQDDLDLVKRVGRAVRADFAVVNTREFIQGHNYRSQVICLNLWTGKKFTDSYMIAPSTSPEAFGEENRKAFRRYYRKLFQEAKADLLKISLRKAESLAAAKPGLQAERAAVAREDLLGETKLPGGLPEDAFLEAEPQPRPARKGAGEIAPLRKGARAGKTRIVVYDFASPENLSVPSLILTEALREELLKRGDFVLVNREDLGRLAGEMKVQQSGMIDEKQAVRLGKGLAAAEAVTGRLHTLGNTYILQAKRTDIETMGTLSIGSLKCPVGREEELLAQMPLLAKKLAGD